MIQFYITFGTLILGLIMIIKHDIKYNKKRNK